jgi:Zn-dependent protease
VGVVLGTVLRFAPSSGGGVWPGLAFLAYLQMWAVVLNLIPLPPFDGFGVIEPWLPMNLRSSVAQVSGLLPLLVFLLLWYVPFVYRGIAALVSFLAGLVGIPLGLAQAGLSGFMFWR